MKRKMMIAIVAILTMTLLLAGCAVAPATAAAATEETLQSESYDTYGRNAGASYGTRGENTTLAYGNQGGNGYGNQGGGTYGLDTCDTDSYETTADPDYTVTDADKALSLTGYGSTGALGDESLTLADMLSYAIQDEYLARAEYDQILTDFGSVRPFSNILRAEEAHIDALLPLFTAYGIAAPEDESANYTASVAALTDAYQAGVNAEINNIAMYELFLDQNLPDDVRTVFTSLMHASENHLRAFQNRL